MILRTVLDSQVNQEPLVYSLSADRLSKVTLKTVLDSQVNQEPLVFSLSAERLSMYCSKER